MNRSYKIKPIHATMRLDRWIRNKLGKIPQSFIEKNIRIGPPISRPSKIVCVGLNYAKHAAESGMDVPSEPVLFFKSSSAITGPFDPITLGHIDIIRRASLLVDRLVIGVAINRDKAPLFTLEERVEMLEKDCADLSEQTGTEIIVHPFENLLINCAHDVGAQVIVRGLRAVADFEYEFQMVGMNRSLDY